VNAVAHRERRLRPAGARARLAATTIAAACAAVVATGIAVHEASGRLGTALPPFVSVPGAAVDPLAGAAAALLALCVLAAPRALVAPRRPPAFAAALLAVTLALALAVNAARHGAGAWSAIFDTGPGGSFEARNEYLPALPAADYGGHFLLDRFALLVPSLPANAAGHPPGVLLVLHWTGIRSAAGLAALCIAAAAAVPPLTYALARNVLATERAARTAGLLAMLSPGILLFATTSVDALYAAAGVAAACLLAARAPATRALGAGVLAAASLLSWALLAIGAWGAVLAWRREGLRAALALAAACAAAVVAFDATLAGLWGYDPIAALRATEAIYRHSLAAVRPYWFWIAGSPDAWLVMLGLPVAGGWLVAVGRARPAAVALAVVIVAAAVLGFTKAETERIWLPFAPLACVAAAEVLPARALRPALLVLAVHALAWQLLFDTIW
jgi:hypothetical protein